MRTYLISLCTTPLECMKWTPERSDLNHSFARDSDTSTGTREGRYALETRMSWSKNSREQDGHCDERIRRGDDERMKGYDGWMWVVLEWSNDLHFIPSDASVVVSWVERRLARETYKERTLAAVVEVLERWTSFTATSMSLTLPEADFGRQSHTLPQFPNPI